MKTKTKAKTKAETRSPAGESAGARGRAPKKVDPLKLGFGWNVWVWDFNHDRLERYDVVPALVDELNRLKSGEKPRTKEEFGAFLEGEAGYRFRAKCEYEMIVHGWPVQKRETKVDVYGQLRLNWDSFVDAFWKSLESYAFFAAKRASRKETAA